MTDRAENYIAELYAAQKLTKSKYAAQTELQHYGAVIDDDVARTLQVLIKATCPRKVLEIGTSIGYSTVMMAKTMSHYGGQIISLELDEATARQAELNFRRQGVDKQIQVVVGDAHDALPDESGTFDMIFQDVGNKSLYAEMLNDYLRLLKPGGLLVAEDVLYPASQPELDGDYAAMCEPLDRFNRAVIDCEQFESTMLPIGDGLMVAVRK